MGAIAAKRFRKFDRELTQWPILSSRGLGSVERDPHGQGAAANLLERLFLEERRRTKIIPNAFGERPVLELMYAAPTAGDPRRARPRSRRTRGAGRRRQGDRGRQKNQSRPVIATGRGSALATISEWAAISRYPRNAPVGSPRSASSLQRPWDLTYLSGSPTPLPAALRAPTFTGTRHLARKRYSDHEPLAPLRLQLPVDVFR